MGNPEENIVLDPSDPVELTRQLCNIPSVSGDEKRIADAIEALLRGAQHLSVYRDGDTLVARTELGRAKRVIIAGHIDTVPINENLPVRDIVELANLGSASVPAGSGEGEAMIWGRGTVDMKAGAAVQLSLALELSAPAVDVTWVWYDHEEVASELNGLGRTLRGRPELFEGDFAILCEPSNGAIEGGCNGTLRARVSMLGKRAHSARSWMGVNAIHRAGDLLHLALVAVVLRIVRGGPQKADIRPGILGPAE